MDNKEFKLQMDRMIDTFGQENYGKERMKMIYSECQDLSNEELRWVVDHLIAHVPTKYPPLIPRFKEAIHGVLAKRFNKTVKGATEKIDQRSGLKEMLNSLGAKSLVDAINKVKNL